MEIDDSNPDSFSERIAVDASRTSAALEATHMNETAEARQTQSRVTKALNNFLPGVHREIDPKNVAIELSASAAENNDFVVFGVKDKKLVSHRAGSTASVCEAEIEGQTCKLAVETSRTNGRHPVDAAETFGAHAARGNIKSVRERASTGSSPDSNRSSIANDDCESALDSPRQRAAEKLKPERHTANESPSSSEYDNLISTPRTDCVARGSPDVLAYGGGYGDRFLAPCADDPVAVSARDIVCRKSSGEMIAEQTSETPSDFEVEASPSRSEQKSDAGPRGSSTKRHTNTTNLYSINALKTTQTQTNASRQNIPHHLHAAESSAILTSTKKRAVSAYSLW